MKLSILTLDNALFEGEAQSVTVPGISGKLQALEHHVPLITALKKGIIVVTDQQGVQEFSIEHGVLEVRPDEINILVS